jgi:hypothetical protein
MDEQEAIVFRQALELLGQLLPGGQKAKDPGVGGGVDRSKIPAGDFAGPNSSYPIVIPGDVSDAASLVGKADDPEAVKRKIISIAKRKGAAFTAQLPEKWKKEENIKSVDLSYVLRIGMQQPDDELAKLLAVKHVTTDLIRHPVFVWGHPDKKDVEGEYFDRNTDLWDATLGGAPRPLTWDHMQDDSLKASPVIGKTLEWEDDEVARWAISQLDRAHRYRKAVDALIEQGALGSSSDTALQYVIRQPTKSGATYIKQWPWFASALTTTPAEPRTIEGVEYFKSLGVTYPMPEVPEQERARLMEATLRARNQHLRKLTE